MRKAGVTRRRALTILAAGAVAGLGAARRMPDPVEWKGMALGADARLVFFGTGVSQAEEAIGDCLAEIDRLEQSFSLYRRDAEIIALNDTGFLRHPSVDLRRLLQICRIVNLGSGGLFDPTIQPLWRLYAQWFANATDRQPPIEALRAPLMAQIGLRNVELGPDSMRLHNAAQITLNGVAQGYITDRVAELLRARGWSHVLIDLGEVRALDGRPDGAPFRVFAQHGGFSLPLTNAAFATSSADALVFSATLGLAHILHPRTGLTPAHWASVSVRHPSATIADALSTALFLADEKEGMRIARAFPDTTVWATRHDGTTCVW